MGNWRNQLNLRVHWEEIYPRTKTKNAGWYGWKAKIGHSERSSENITQTSK